MSSLMTEHLKDCKSKFQGEEEEGRSCKRVVVLDIQQNLKQSNIVEAKYNI